MPDIEFIRGEIERMRLQVHRQRGEIRQLQRARGELRVKLQQAIDQRHSESMLQAGPGQAETASKALLAILTNVQGEGDTMRNVMMPRYRHMIDTFRDKMWLAEPETRQYFSKLIEFVDVWDKVLADKLPRDLAPRIGHTEQNLAEFYAHLEEMLDKLKSEI